MSLRLTTKNNMITSIQDRYRYISSDVVGLNRQKFNDVDIEMVVSVLKYSFNL